MTLQHTGDLLFHCWSHADREAGHRIFQSIVEKGFLLTINSGPLDSFQYNAGGKVAQMDVMQLARVCFTEIPLGQLHTHGYGHFGVGFSRPTMVDWGACPAWYLPNHPGDRTMKESGAEVIRGLHASAVGLDNMRAIVRDIPPTLKQHIPAQYLSRDFDFEVKFTHGSTLKGPSLLDWITQSEHSLRRTLSFIKELSPRSMEDFRYLYEREWRIVDGVAFKGKTVFRPLIDAEKSELCNIRNAWAEKIKSDDINVQLRYGNTRLVDHFRYFNGFDHPVSRMIEVILVPDRAAKRHVQDYVDAHRAIFRTNVPRVQLFPSNMIRRWSWRLREMVATV
jgi:hypothetical protein